MIEGDEPGSWRELQERVARILRETGVDTVVEKVVQTARGEVSIDVWAHDPVGVPPQTYLIECKRWRARLPQTVVHAFRTVVGDSGASWGAIISASGFQKGARMAAYYSNVRLLTWAEFQSLFAERWFSRHFTTVVTNASGPLIDYTEPVNTRVFRKADLLTEDRRQEFHRLRQVHGPLGTLCLAFGASTMVALQMFMDVKAPIRMPDLPLRSTLQSLFQAKGLLVADAILDATSYRTLLDSIVKEAIAAIAEFDAVFGERA